MAKTVGHGGGGGGNRVRVTECVGVGVRVGSLVPDLVGDFETVNEPDWVREGEPDTLVLTVPVKVVEYVNPPPDRVLDGEAVIDDVWVVVGGGVIVGVSVVERVTVEEVVQEPDAVGIDRLSERDTDTVAEALGVGGGVMVAVAVKDSLNDNSSESDFELFDVIV